MDTYGSEKINVAKGVKKINYKSWVKKTYIKKNIIQKSRQGARKDGNK